MQTADETMTFPPSDEAMRFATAMFAIHTRFVPADEYGSFLNDVASHTQIPRPRDVFEDTRKVAEWFGFPLDTVYLFLGRAFWRGPKHKPNVAVAVRIVHMVHTATGTVTPFDTGCLRHHPRQFYLMKLPIATQPRSARIDYLNNNRRLVQDCVAYLAAHVTRYFQQPEDYWKEPHRPIDGVTMTRDDWRDWTFEMQIDPPVDCSDPEAILYLGETERGDGTSIRAEYDRLLQNGLISGIAYCPTSNPRRESVNDIRRRVIEATRA